MEYTRKFSELKDLYDPDKMNLQVQSSGIRIYNTPFLSDHPGPEFNNRQDISIRENISFIYPVFAPANGTPEKAILLLHGLNERSWTKYLAWAYYLSEQTGSYVILFPISFHINRSPSSWSDPRQMTALARERTGGPENAMSTFANAALSKRLNEDPMRFFYSGYRTVLDIVKLMQTIKKGEHEIIRPVKCVNIFSYSIGAFLAEIIMMANPANLFPDSKLFMFAGGSVFSNMKGTSRFIMDRRAFDRIYSYYLNDFETELTERNPMYDFFNSSGLGLSFRSMIDLGRFKSFREKILGKLRDQVCAISLLRDEIIPASGILATLRDLISRNVELVDFPYPYSHENPFSPARQQAQPESGRLL